MNIINHGNEVLEQTGGDYAGLRKQTDMSMV
jgi:hypothetical protein